MSDVFSWRDAPPADYAVIGDPVAHSRSPRMHQAAYAALGLPYRYVAVHVPRGEVPEALDRLAALGYRGANVTVPHKEDALRWSEIREPYAEQARSANTIRFADRACRSTDGPGFMATIAGLPKDQGDVLMLGAGGSARALAISLVSAGIRLRIYNRTRARAEALASSLFGLATLVEEPDPAGAFLILNTTSASLTGEDLPIAWSRAEPFATAYDLSYGHEAPFLRRAAEASLATLDGLPLLVEQGALSFEWWTGQGAPRAAMRQAIQ